MIFGLSFGAPVFLWLLLPLLGVALWRWRRAPRPADGGSERLLAELPRSWRTRLMWLPGALGLLAGALLILAAARPQEGRQQVRLVTEGVDIQLVVDISSSMLQAGMDETGRLNNLEVVKGVVAQFIESREDDRIGLVSYARYPRTECPLTLDNEALLGTLEGLRCVRANGEDDGTAIGVAVGYAARKLMDSPARSRVIVLLTDGEENSWAIHPQDAAALCEDEGIRVYTIGAGRRVVRSPLTGRRELVELDTSQIEALAEQTGGRFYLAEDLETLSRVYEEINALETTEREDIRYTDYVDKYHLLLIPALILLLLEAWLSRGPLLELSA